MTQIKVMVVDDSVVIRRLVTDLLAADPDIEVVGTAVNGKAALAKLELLHPDVVTMDIEMPEMDGIEAVRQIRALGNRVPIVMFSTLSERGAVATLDALAAGATDYVAKPANVGSVGRSMEQVREALIPKIKALAPPRVGAAPATEIARRPASASSAVAPTSRVTLRQRAVPPAAGYQLLVVGSSTGGPEALSSLFSALPELSVPVVVVQHMPPLFTRQLAARIDRRSAAHVVEAEHGQPLRPGLVAIAPGDFHLSVASGRSGLMAQLSQGPAENYCRPAVDVLFRSAVDAVGGAVLGVVLTGMGQDGCLGSQRIIEAGGSVIVQDQATSVVWGMPGAVAQAGLAEQIMPLDAIAPELAHRLPTARPPAPARHGLTSVGAPR